MEMWENKKERIYLLPLYSSLTLNIQVHEKSSVFVVLCIDTVITVVTSYGNIAALPAELINQCFSNASSSLVRLPTGECM
jgi:hypothetical protein